MRHILAVTFSGLLVPLLAFSDEPRHFALQTPHNVSDITVEDVSGDGRADIVAFCSEKDVYPLNKQIAIFLAREEGGFAPEPSHVLSVAPETGPAFFAQVDGTGARELVLTSPRGATVYAFRDGAFHIVAEPRFSSLLPGGSREPRFIQQLAQDLTGDGKDEWLLPIAMGYEIRNLEGLAVEVKSDVVSEVRTSASTNVLLISHRLPDMLAFDIADQAQKGLAFLTDEFADFAYGDAWDQHVRFEIPMDLAEKWDTNAQMKDINGNGLPDLIVTQTEGTINVTVLTQVYLAQGPYTYPETPSATFQTRGAFASPVFADVNGNGKLDMIYIKVPFGVSFFANLLVRKKVKFNTEVYLFDNDTYPERPNYTTSLTIDAPDGREQVAYTLGDFNGDGRIDAAFGSGNNELNIYLGEEQRLIGSRPWKTFQVVPFGEARTVQLTGNGRDDIIIFHTTGENRKTINVLLF